jgi:hypothetical protein
MDHSDQKPDIKNLIDDINYIKEMVSRNNPFLHEAGISKGVQIVSLVGGIVIIFFSGIFQWLIQTYGSFPAIPTGIKLSLFIVQGIIWIVLGVYKQYSILSSMKAANPSLTFAIILRDLYNRYTVHTYLPPAIIAIVLSLYFLLSGNVQFIVPTIAIGLGLVSNGASVGFRIPEMLVMGYWFLFSGITSLIFYRISACISLSYTVGLGFIIFSISAYVSNRKREARGA